MTLRRQITIFEGCDGSGKSTAAKTFAENTNAKLVHLGPFASVKHGLGRLYVEAMLPALQGYQDVVLDRSWLSEPVYGAVFRDGEDRLGTIGRRMLARLALSCGALVVKCDPGWDQVLQTYKARQQREVLNGLTVHEGRLEEVYELYQDLDTMMPQTHHNFLSHPVFKDSPILRPLRHQVGVLSAGNWDAVNWLVGQDFAQHKEADSLYQWPFAGFSKGGCAPWLTAQLEAMNQSEHNLAWVNADQDLEALPLRNRRVYALGNVAHERLRILNIPHIRVPHPQAWKRFHTNQPYPLEF